MKAPTPAFYLGCPIWACGEWLGSVFTAEAKRNDWLRQYSVAFNTVEGNSTFYGLPTLDTVKRWADETQDGFRFCLKFPRAISHDHELIDAQADTAAFLETLEVLAQANRLGPSFLQLSPRFSGQQMRWLDSYLRSLPRPFPYALEVRHSDFFDEGKIENELDSLLRDLEIDRVIFDSRGLFSAPPSDEFERDAQGRKPRSPLRHTVTGPRPLLRIVGRNDVVATQPWFDEWAPIVARWIQAGLKPFVFTHAPHDKFAPQHARAFHATLSKHLSDLPPLAPWPGEQAAATRKRQRELF